MSSKNDENMQDKVNGSPKFNSCYLLCVVKWTKANCPWAEVGVSISRDEILFSTESLQTTLEV